MKVIGQPKPRVTVTVASAPGPDGSLVGKMARIAGARAVGVAGGKDKCDYVREELGLDAVVDHRSPTFDTERATACPDGIDVYYEYVGGHVWAAVFPLLNLYARVPVCGLIAQYNGPGEYSGDKLPTLMSAILRRSLLLRGFIKTEFLDTHYEAFQKEIGPLAIKARCRFL